LRAAGAGKTDEERINAALRERVAALGAASLAGRSRSGRD
jgi:hypothetical protein